MARPIQITITEDLAELKYLAKTLPSHTRDRARMLYLMKHDGITSKSELGTALSVSPDTVQKWRDKYKKGGIELMLEDKRGGTKPAQITPEAHEKLAERLSEPTGAFRSYIEAQEWINREFGLDMGYHAVNKYLKRRFGAKLKVARRSHIDKDPAAPAVFKKPFRGA